MRNYKTRIPGIDRASEAKNPGGKLKPSALQKVGNPEGKIMSEPAKYREAPNNFNPKPGTSSNKFLGGLLGGGKPNVKSILTGGLIGSGGKPSVKSLLTGGLLSKKAKYKKR